MPGFACSIVDDAVVVVVVVGGVVVFVFWRCFWARRGNPSTWIASNLPVVGF